MMHPKTLATSSSKLSVKKSWVFPGVAGLCAVVSFAAFLFPAWYSFFSRNIFIYVNAWDEETYLSYLGALSSQFTPGYSSSWVIVFLHNIGFSGSIQNLIFDSIIPALIFLIIFRWQRRQGFRMEESLVNSSLIVFGSVLFNNANPLINFWNSNSIEYGTYYGLVSGREYYPSILRTPNPQFSYLYLALLLLPKNVKKIWLLAPIPFLYPFVTIPYVFSLTFLFGAIKISSRIAWELRILAAAIISWLFYGVLMIFFRLYINQDEGLSQTNLLLEGRHFFVPPQFLIFSTILIFIFWRTKGNFTNRLAQISYRTSYALLIGAIFTLNLQIIAGYTLSHKNFLDVAVSVISPVILVCIATVFNRDQSFGNHIRKLAPYTLCLFLLWSTHLVLRSQGLFLRERKFSIWMGASMSNEDLERFKKSPTSAMISDLNLASKIAYSIPKSKSPAFSYQFYFPSMFNYCRETAEILNAGIKIASEPTFPKNEAQYFTSLGNEILKRNANPRYSKKHKEFCDIQSEQPFLINKDSSPEIVNLRF